MKKLSIIAITIFAGVVLSGCMGKSYDDKTFDELAYGEGSAVNLTSEQHEQVGDGYVRRAKPEMALVHFNKAIELDGDNLDARVKRGELLVDQGLDEQALAEFTKVLEKDPNHAIANEAAGCVYFRSGLYDEAEAHLIRAVELNPMLWKAHNFLGIIYDRNRDYDKAAKEFSAALELHRGNGVDEIYNNLGVVHIARKQYAQAVETFRQALQAGGVSSRTYNNLGLALARMGRLDEALESFKYAGGEAKANNNLGYVLLTENQPAQAAPYFEKAIELSPNYYVKAADNLKRARLAARFQEIGTQLSGSTPNPLLRTSFPDVKQNPGEPAASPASAGSPPPPVKAVQAVLNEQGSGDKNIIPREKTYGLHISSWHNEKNALLQCEDLKKQGFETWINQVDLGDKGVWYRVLVGKFSSVREARAERPDVLTILNLDSAPIFEREDPEPVVSAQL
ncbi:Tetratricopeptide TPR_1 repeat-containing protein [Pseudodesulfovibrio mercurii]|uniref:Tetratricopeptide TPR_1 repeat-containing protein n=1 Tax=Pseudodesulfovibrio mercurii TaxID=641491 RepID=F0JJR4_9BACT|nr:SPOR domain-containing protein [Pseudodesulfovibrio mercurii]EGB16163.1 Tetratricopeptide TPR_1 repeat-containing protein [Pseudodesulfovibrio mercurii]